MRRAVVVVIVLVLAAAGIAAGLALHPGQARCSCLAAQLLSPSPTSPSPPDTRSYERATHAFAPKAHLKPLLKGPPGFEPGTNEL